MKKLTLALAPLALLLPTVANANEAEISVRESTQISRNGGYRGRSYQGNGGYQRQGRVNIPRGHYPPPGECKVWDPALPPGQQSPPIPCSSLPTYVYGDGRIIVYSDGTQEPY